MAAPKGHKRYGGRAKGTPNRATTEARAVFTRLLENQGPQLESMIEETRAQDPSKAAALILQAAEFCIPKLARLEKTLAEYKTEELLEELRRREREEAPKPPAPETPPMGVGIQ